MAAAIGDKGDFFLTAIDADDDVIVLTFENSGRFIKERVEGIERVSLCSFECRGMRCRIHMRCYIPRNPQEENGFPHCTSCFGEVSDAERLLFGLELLYPLLRADSFEENRVSYEDFIAMKQGREE